MAATVRAGAKLIALALLVLALGACTRSLEGNYRPGLDLSDVKVAKEVSVGIAQFEDKRSWVTSDEPKSVSFIASQDPWKFGLTYAGREFAPVSEILQDIFYQEFVAAGMRAQKLSAPLSDAQAPAGAAEPVDYVLGGKITTFEFANSAGVITVTTRRAVSLSLTLVKVGGSPVFADRAFDEQVSEGEGMGVLHSTNVDKLLNIVLKGAVKKVIKGVSDGINGAVANVEIRIIDGARVASYTFDGDLLYPVTTEVASAQ